VETRDRRAPGTKSSSDQTITNDDKRDPEMNVADVTVEILLTGVGFG
jgi:hypothetical protein